MTVFVPMPKLSPTMESGEILTFLVKEGDRVQEGDPLFEVATDKATIEYQSIEEGFLREFLVSEGSCVTIGSLVAVITKTHDETYSVPQTVKKDHKSPSDSFVKRDDEKEIKHSFINKKIESKYGKIAPPLSNYTHIQCENLVKATPLAKRAANARNMDMVSIYKEKNNKKVCEKDVLQAQKQSISFHSRIVPSTLPGSHVKEKPSFQQQFIGDKLSFSKATVPHFYVTMEINVSKLLDVKEEMKGLGYGFTLNDYIMRSVAIALQENMKINSGFDIDSGEIISFNSVDIACAVATSSGLITPIVRHANFKNIRNISSEMKELISKARRDALSPEEHTGGSFTVSNLGMYGVKDFQPIINVPQSAILGVGGVVVKPYYVKEQLHRGSFMNFTVSGDHRVIDGADVGKFLKSLKKYIEAPSSIII